MQSNPKTGTAALSGSRIIQWSYAALIFLMALTGFGQMPIYKRYYISDIPGFAWLADFWTTRYVHYVGAVVLLALLAYIAVEYLGARLKNRKLSVSGWLRLILLGVIVTTGILFVLKNFSIYLFSPESIVFMTFCHLGSVMAFLLTNLYCLVFKKQWTTSR